ncbi:MAG: hypothetical protein ACR2NZ_12940 [Rubripirellula sp.]
MLEILIVIGLCRSMGKMLRAKGRKPLLMQIMLVVMWIVGEFTGGFIAGIVHVLRHGENVEMGFGVYVFAIVGAVIGAGITFLIAHLLPSQDEPQMVTAQDPFDQRVRDVNNPYAP